MYEASKKDIVIKMLERKQKENKEIIAALEVEMMKIVANDVKIQTSYQLITSIKGIGKANGLMTIAYIENFTSFTNPRAYAVYVGVIPFDHSSGTSIRGRKTVSHLANKELKQELNQAAKSATAWDKEIKNYSDNKIENKVLQNRFEQHKI
ncbi:MAG: family transposase [Ferruginibacter sp.]|uniref:IS110 family transposase n=1 Tax=Ferruginibacter sp. TaxID=1940288 RepID=UPI00265A0A9E|nr:IS110 family transposase [Ferruginibacter sp.]MDB5279257.1 family transposase [Ferruginibacter sp.]